MRSNYRGAAGRVAYGAMFSAFIYLLVLLPAYLPTAKLFIHILAGLSLAASGFMLGRKTLLLIFAVVGALAVFVLPGMYYGLLFLCYYGLVPLLYQLLAPYGYIVRTSLIHLIVTIAVILFIKLFGMAQIYRILPGFTLMAKYIFGFLLLEITIFVYTIILKNFLSWFSQHFDFLLRKFM